jgi:pyruvate dehydrogenase E2 component (dihydrolipoamide acetyltransferase)
MPKLGFDMAAGTLVRKVKRDGETVAKGEPIAEIETDKTTVEVEAYIGGVVAGWLVAEGEQVPVGTPMVVIAAPGEKVDLDSIRAGQGAASPSITPTPSASAASPAASPAPVEPAARIVASPVARRMADDADLDIRRVTGTGPGGRITKKDIEAALKAAPSAPLLPAPRPVSITLDDETVPLTKLRQIIARRMTESTTTIPQFYVTSDIDMSAAMDLRKQINALLPDEGKASVNDFIVKAAALALRQFPNLNSTFAGDKLIRKGHVNLGIAVAVSGGLLTVVVRDADQKPLTQIAAEVKPMVARAREGKVQPADIEGSTFSISNLGMYDVENFIAIINPPEAAILAVGSVRETPVVKNGALVPGLRLTATCSADHRVTDGAEVAQFMQAVKKNLEEPLRLLV